MEFYKAWYSEIGVKKSANVVRLLSCRLHFLSERILSICSSFSCANSTPSEILYNAIDTDLFAPSTPKDTDLYVLVTEIFMLFYRLEHTIIALGTHSNKGWIVD